MRLNLDDKFNSLTSIPHLAARLRQQIAPDLVESLTNPCFVVTNLHPP